MIMSNIVFETTNRTTKIELPEINKKVIFSSVLHYFLGFQVVFTIYCLLFATEYCM